MPTELTSQVVLSTQILELDYRLKHRCFLRQQGQRAKDRQLEEVQSAGLEHVGIRISSEPLRYDGIAVRDVILHPAPGAEILLAGDAFYSRKG